MVLEIKFIKGKNFNENWKAQNQKVGIKNLKKYTKIEKNFLAILWHKGIKNLVDSC